MVTVLSAAAILALLGTIEGHTHRRRLSAIPVRIHVNGTRGKSSTTRLIAAGLRAAGIRVIAKTTGSAARLIFADGSEIPIKRGKRVSILEQLWVVAEAAKCGAEVLVVECMALSPENQWVSEHRMIQSTIGVITNVRQDHLDEMGPEMADIAQALATTIPQHGYLVTAERQYLPELRHTAHQRGTIVHPVSAASLTPQEIALFPSFVFMDNVACALKVCELLGVARNDSLAGMAKMNQDPGAFTLHRLDSGSRRIYFANALAANDKTSTVMLWRQCCQLAELSGLPVIGVMNNRSDRPQRIRELATVVKEIPFEHLFLLGGLGRIAARCIARAGLANEQITDLTNLRAALALDRILAEVSGDALVFAFGNIKGPGWELAHYFADKGVKCHDLAGGRNRNHSELCMH